MSPKKKKSKLSKRFQKKIKAKKSVKDHVGDSQKLLMQKIKNQSANEGCEVVIDTSNPQKMSEIILHYAEPLLESATTVEDEETAVVMALTLWNLALVPESERQGMIESLFSKIFEGNYPADFDEIVTFFMKRKQLLYPDVNRMILDYDCTKTPDGLHLNVVSSME